MRTRAAHEGDFDAILALQNANLVSHLPMDARGDGFVTTDLSRDLDELLNRRAVLICEADHALAAYVVLCDWAFFAHWPIFAAMIARFPLSWRNRSLTAHNSWQYGPVCVAREWRGRGVLALLFAACRAELRKRELFGVTFINADNARSLRAHRDKLGMEVVDEFSFADNRYLTLAFEP